MSSSDHILRLISKKLTAEPTEQELHELQELLQKNPEMQQVMELATALWKSGVKINDAEAERIYARHMERLSRKILQNQEAKKPIWVNQSNRKESFYRFFNFGIFTNYFKVIYRNLYRFKSFSIINISGLAIGMASAILILLLVQNELSYDRFHEKKDRIYLLYNNVTYNGKLETGNGTPMVLAPVLKSNYPQVEEVTRINGTGPLVLSVGEKHLEVRGMMADAAFLKIFSYPLAKGNPADALGSPRSIVVTEKLAKKLFADGDAMGKIIRVDGNAYFTVTGILKDLPNNTTFNFVEYLLPWSYMKEVGWENQSWGYDGILTFVLLRPGVTEQTANTNFLLNKHPRCSTCMAISTIQKSG